MIKLSLQVGDNAMKIFFHYTDSLRGRGRKTLPKGKNIIDTLTVLTHK